MSLFDSTDTANTSPAEASDNTQPSASPGTEAPTWYWDENVPGVGERPSYLPDKYKTVAEVAKAQRELESRLGSAPKEYDLSKATGWIDAEKLKPVVDLAKSKHVSQDVLDTFLGTVANHFESMKPNMALERQRLGENADKRIETVKNWAQANLSEKSFKALTGSMTSAEAIEAVEELRAKALNAETMVPTGNEGLGGGGLTMDDYRAELNDNYEKYKKDPAFQRKMQGMLEKIKAGEQR